METNSKCKPKKIYALMPMKSNIKNLDQTKSNNHGHIKDQLAQQEQLLELLKLAIKALHSMIDKFQKTMLVKTMIF